MIFAARQIQEKCQDNFCSLYVTFVDLTKAFGTVSREGLWEIMGKFSCPTKFTNIVRKLNGVMLAKVMANGEESCIIFSEACDNFGLTINTKKTEVVH